LIDRDGTGQPSQMRGVQEDSARRIKHADCIAISDSKDVIVVLVHRQGIWRRTKGHPAHERPTGGVEHGDSAPSGNEDACRAHVHGQPTCAGIFVLHKPFDRLGCWRAHRHSAEDRIMRQVKDANRAIAVADEGATGLRVEG
jgi:hypothetical protein